MLVYEVIMNLLLGKNNKLILEYTVTNGSMITWLYFNI